MAAPHLPPLPPLQPDPHRPQQALCVLALDTSTAHLSVALGRWSCPLACATGDFAAPARIWSHTGAGAAQSSATLVPTVQTLLQQADMRLSDLHAIAFGAGPGSFTGLRTACAVAQGLALGAGIPVLPVHTLLAVAEDWRLSASHPIPPGQTLWTLLDARMDEMYAAQWRWQPAAPTHTPLHPPPPAPTSPCWHPVQAATLVKPEHWPHLPQWSAHQHAAGNVQPVYGHRLPTPVAHALPTATAMLHLAPALLRAGNACDAALALPQYVRDKVAQTTAERNAAHHAAPHTTPAHGAH